MPKISINIPCYNRVNLLRKCVDSFINQSYKNYEIIIVDDGSEDDLTFVRTIDQRIKYFRQEKLGISKARNLAISKSTGDYILIFDSDDLVTDKDFLKKLVETLEREKENGYHVVYSDYIKRFDNGNEKIIRFKQIDDNCYERMLHNQYIPHPGTLWIKDKIPKYNEKLESSVDWDLFLNAIKKGVKFYHIPEALWTYNNGSHPREFNTERQAECCDRLLRKRGYRFNKKTRKGIKIK